jgi:signal transduction histidine kinase
VITERYLKTASILYDQERATHGYNTDLAAIRYAAQNIERWLGRLNVHPPSSPSQAAAMQEVEYRVRDIMAVQDNMASQLMTVMHHSNSTSFIVKVSDAEFCYKPYTDIIMRIISAKRGMSECYARNELHLTFNGKPKAEDDFIRIPALRVSVGDLFLAFRNLVENAIKYSIKGIRPTLDISWSNLDNRYIEFHFSDCGIGVPVAEQPLLMREGFRGRKAQELQLRGNGLGLTVSKTVIERAGGTIYFRKKPGSSKGACFVLRVPILQEKTT